ncbi:MAG: mandelate racemase/muconate lactonizing enzyme family protein [Nitrososphaerota archaeon]|nr:mandelate racemase/muconate lactonizing enzyme family protein [Nitrososphaerota archaeon]
MPLKITDVKAATVEGNYQWTFAKVYAGAQSGIGEAFPAPQLEGVIREYAPLVIGEDAFDVNRIMDKLRWASVPSGTFGANYHAFSAIEIAILDLLGRHLNLPVYALLGGKFRDKVRIYADAHAGKALESMSRVLLPTVPLWMRELGVAPPEAVEREPVHGRATPMAYAEEYNSRAYGARAKELKGEGFTAVKFDLDIPTPYTTRHSQETGSLSNQETGYLAGLVGEVREAVGEETDILFDLHWKYDVNNSVRLAKSIEPYGVMWLEDPVPPENVSLLREVTSSTTTPIASGENLYGRYQFEQLLGTGIRVATPDAPKAGGLLESRFIAQMAAMKEITISPHNISSPIGTVAQAHLAASIPNFGVLEFHGHDVPLWYKLSKKKVIRDGFIQLDDEPGLGVELDEAVAARYSLDGEFDL